MKQQARSNRQHPDQSGRFEKTSSTRRISLYARAVVGWDAGEALAHSLTQGPGRTGSEATDARVEARAPRVDRSGPKKGKVRSTSHFLRHMH